MKNQKAKGKYQKSKMKKRGSFLLQFDF